MKLLSTFQVSQRNTTIERLVCNFAPKGNIHGRPVYSIGYPATQCSKYIRPDEKFLGLCNNYNIMRENGKHSMVIILPKHIYVTTLP